MSQRNGDRTEQAFIGAMAPEIRCSVASRGRIYLHARESVGDPVELNEGQARALARVLRALADEADAVEGSP